MLTNIACYKFTPLENLPALRLALLESCRSWNLKGTILLSPEGINLFVSGSRNHIDLLLNYLHTLPGLEDLTPKFSPSLAQPFRRMLVRLKKEIISFGQADIVPSQRTSPKLAPKLLKQWLDEGKPITLLDTRNDYEIKLGTFKNALIPHIDHFRQFPDAVKNIPDELKDQPIVMFCTGGIRCEKAGPYMEQQGFKNIFQLEGGILKYFEDCGSAHYEGECFVFDHRVGVDPALRETPSALCFNCQAPLTEEEQKDPRYVPPHSCPHCYQSVEEKLSACLHDRHEALRRVSLPLPGSIPYDNVRPIKIPPAQHGTTLLDGLCAIFPQIDRKEWLTRCALNRFRNEKDEILHATSLLQQGERIKQLFPNNTEPPVNPNIRVLFEDAAIVILNKPAPLPMHPGGRFNKNTLEFFLDCAFKPTRLKPAHRLDANTSGLILCGKNRNIAGRLQPQFERGEVEKTYLARVNGRPSWREFVCEAPISHEPGLVGSRTVDSENGKMALTKFKVLDTQRDETTTLLEVQPLTGRTNQIRVHLWHLGFPICGDPTYLPNQQLGATQTLNLEEPPLCLHAWKLTFRHPVTNEQVFFTADPPNYLV